MNAAQGASEEFEILKRQLSEANDTLRAIRNGEVDAVVVQGPEGSQVYTLQTADHPYRILVQQMNEGALMLSREGFVLHANPCFADLVGALPEMLNAEAIDEWIAPEDVDSFEKALHLAFQGQAQRLELNLVPREPEGARVPVVLSLAALDMERMDGVCAIITDLRERRNRESLERAELLARSLMDHATAAVVITGRDGRILRANAAAEALAGRSLTSEYFAGAFPLILDAPATIPTEHVKMWAENLARLASMGSSYRGLQARMRRSNGRIVELQVSAGPFAAGGTDIAGAVFTLADVTPLRNSEQRFRALAESIPQIVWTLNRTGKLDYCNTVGKDYFGVASVEQLAGGWDSVIHPDDAAQLQAWLQESRTTGQPLQAEFRMISAAGEARWFLVRAVPVRDASGQITQWFGTSTDVDAQKKVENDLRRANTDLEHFAYAASHDFQEPLRMVTAYTQLLQREFGGQLDDPAAMYLKYVLEGTERLGALLQNLLSYMQASRNPEAEAKLVDCNEVLSEVIANLELPIRQSGAQITAQNLPTIRCPRVHIVEILQNLLNNAIKYRGADPPAIAVSARKVNGECLFSVQDNGIGIAEQHQENIFGVFKRLHGNDIPGTGIGLAICRRLVEQHRGRIWVESQLNHGSTFCFTLPGTALERLNESAGA